MGRIKRKVKVCRYFNRGLCKYKNECRFIHSKKICEKHLKTPKCEINKCQDRHPKPCKWFNSSEGCSRSSGCEYLLVTVASEETVNYRCEGCKDEWTKRNCVVEYVISNRKLYFCLNCDEWINFESNVLNDGWTLLDEAGN